MSQSIRVVGATCAFLLLGAGAPTLAAQNTADQQTQGKSAVSKSDRGYFDDIAQANLAEVQAGKLAQSKASSSEVKDFAQHMIDDHGKMLDEQRTMAKEKNIAMPSKPERKQQDAMKRLEKLSGAEFDRAFMEQMVKDHQDALKLVNKVAAKASDPDLKAAAQKAAPEIEQHLQSAKQLASQTGAKVSSSK